MSSFFRAKLSAIKEKQGQQDPKQDKILTQLASMEELLYFSMIMLKRMILSEALDLPIPTLAAVGTSAQPPVAEPPAAVPQPFDPDVATESSEAKPKPPIAISSKAKTSSKKKTKKKK